MKVTLKFTPPHFILISIFSICFAMQTNAQTIQLATWDFANANTTPTLASGIGSATIATSGNIQVSSSFTNSFSVTNLSATTLAQAKNGNGTIPAYYISVTISPNPNFAIDISSVAIQGFSQNRNRTFNLSYIDAQSNLINVQNRTIATPTQAQTFTVSSLTGIQTPIELRFYIFSNPADLYEAAGFGEAAGLDLVINGKITNTTTNPILPGMWSLQGNTVAGTQFFGSVNNEALKIYTNNTEKVRIDSDGNVGIGTTAPTQKLSVAGNINLTGTGTGLIFDDGTFANSWQPVLANSAAISILNTSLSGLTNTVNANFTTLQTSILGIGQAIDIQQTTNQILSSSIVGVSANLANTQTTVANLQTALANSTNSLNNGITFSGAKFDIYTPVQGQYNGYKPIMSMSQYGEINFNSSPYLNDNAMYFGNTGNFNNGIRKANDFGGVGGYSGPVVFGENGGALGSSTANSNWTTTGTKLALSWDANQTVKIHKALQFADGTVQTTAGSNWEMTNNYLTYPQNVNVQGTLKLGTNSLYLGGVSGGIPGSTNEIYTDNGALEIQNQTSGFQNTEINKNGGRVGIGMAAPPLTSFDKVAIKGLVSIKEGGLKVEGDIEILGDNPKIKIGSLVMQDFSRTEITTGTTSNGGQTINFGVVNHLPESFIFGNIVYIEGVDGGRFKSIYSRDMVSFSQYPSNSLSYNLGSCIRFNADEAQLEFITAPISIQNTNGITKAELLAHRSLVIKTPEGLNQPSYIGINKTTPTHALDVVGNIKINTNGNGIIFPDGTKISSLNEINPWAINGNSISYGGNVQITGNNVLEFGAGLVKEQSAGKIGYGTFDAGALCIVGAGTTGSNRRIRFFNEGGAKFDGQIEVNSNVWIKDQYALQFGPRVGLPDGNAASIKLGTSGTDEYLNIFGGTGNGKAYPARKVQIFTEGGGLIQGKMKIQDPWSPIGAGHADALLDVNGNIYSRKNVVTQLNWADDEFDAQSPSLEQEQATATKEKHLIGVPKECELNETGLDLGKMQEIQMRKIEQLYKHLWKMNQRMEQLEKENELLRNR